MKPADEHRESVLCGTHAQVGGVNLVKMGEVDQVSVDGALEEPG